MTGLPRGCHFRMCSQVVSCLGALGIESQQAQGAQTHARWFAVPKRAHGHALHVQTPQATESTPGAAALVSVTR